MTEAEAAVLGRMAQDTNAPKLAAEAIHTLAMARPQGFEESLFEIAGSASSRQLAASALGRLLEEYTEYRTSDAAYEQRMMDAIGQAISRFNDAGFFTYWVGQLVNYFPPSKALPAFDFAAAHAPTSELANRAWAVAAAIRSGTTNPATLRGILEGNR
ncbi:MAG: hypothetical protein HY716_12605 [Planctomycetes bacterium]|nr:hypothetical protein [Planctomycetota bacterium]